MPTPNRTTLLATLLLIVGTSGGWAKDNAAQGADTVQSLLKKNPSLSAEAATLQSLQKLGRKKLARAGAAETGLAEIWRRNPEDLRVASLRIIAADPAVAGYVVRTTGRLNPALNQETMLVAAKANPEFIGFAVQMACGNDPLHYRELALAADAAVPGRSLDVLGGVMASRCEISVGLNWHFSELKKRAQINLAAVLDEAVQWEAEAERIISSYRRSSALLPFKP